MSGGREGRGGRGGEGGEEGISTVAVFFGEPGHPLLPSFLEDTEPLILSNKMLKWPCVLLVMDLRPSFQD